jgi:hypothetical protein
VRHEQPKIIQKMRWPQKRKAPQTGGSSLHYS